MGATMYYMFARSTLVAALALVLLSGGGHLVAFASSPCTDVDQAVATDVVIVGAGMAGLSAYRELKQLQPSLNVVLLEATDRIGGRMKKGQIGGYTVELGAGWLSFEQQSPIWSLAKESSLKTSTTTWLDLQVYGENGKKIQTLFKNRLALFNRGRSPWPQMLRVAKQYRLGTSSIYKGLENIMDVMKQFGYIESDELDAFIRWLNVDWEYCVKDVALLNFGGRKAKLLKSSSESMVIDQRGVEYLAQKFKSDHNIQTGYKSKVSDIIYDQTIDATYKVLVQATDPATSTTCQKYKAKRIIVTVPVGVLRGKGYAINFDPPIKTQNFPMVMGQFNRVYFKFKKQFWDTTNFIAVLRQQQYRGLCNHWQNLNANIPGSNIIFCTLTDEGMDSMVSKQLTPYDLLEPFRTVYGASVVNSSLTETLFPRFDLDPTTGFGAFSYFAPGYTLNQYYSFWGGGNGTGFVKGEGYNDAGEWIVHLSGSASCFAFYEYIDGAFHSGVRSARNVLHSLGYDVSLSSPCDAK